MVYLTRPGLSEGDYITWKWKWTNTPASGIYAATWIDVHIDEKNEKLSVAWLAKSPTYSRFGVYNISDFSVVYESPSGYSYLYDYPDMNQKSGFSLGMMSFSAGGLSRSLQTYLLLARQNHYEIEVWRGGSAALWSRDIRTDCGSDGWLGNGGISLTGKYVLLLVSNTDTGLLRLMLYEGE